MNVSIVRRLIVTQVGRTVRRQHEALKRVDISSPANVLLDLESLGRNTRATNFSLYPGTPLNRVLDTLVSEGREIDLIANLMNRAVDVIEESDEEMRNSKKSEFQSKIFSRFVKYFASNSGYEIFTIFNRNSFAVISSTIHPDKRELLVKLITQPVLRIIALRPEIALDPNKVMAHSGVDGFRSIMDWFHLDLRTLTGENLDKLLSAMRNSKHVHFEILDVWFRVWRPELGLKKNSTPGSSWTLEKLLKEIEKKQSKCMLIELLVRIEEGRDEVVKFMRQRHGFTGIPRFPWSYNVIDESMLQLRIGEPLDPRLLNSTSQSSEKRLIADNIVVDDKDVSTRPRFPVEIIDSDKALTRVKSELTGDVIGVSFLNPQIISISTSRKSFVIDLEACNHIFAIFLLKKLLNDSGKRKIVFSLEAFLTKLQVVLGIDERLHFENVVDLRRGRVKRSLGVRKRNEAELEVSLPEEIAVDETSKSSDQPVMYEKTDHIFGRQNLCDLIQTHLGFFHDRSRIFETPELWLIRPLDPGLVEVAVYDSMFLVLLEDHFMARGFRPTEVLTFDPFR